MGGVARFLYQLTLSLWIGGIAIFTFIVTPAIFGSFDRDMAGQIVGRLFPGYFLYLLCLSLSALVFLLLPWPGRIRHAYRISLALIVLAVAINSFVAFRLHPRITEVKKQIHSFQTTEDSPLRKRFGRLHALSAGLNLIVLSDGLVLLLLSRGLRE
jgi:hypothetical protein